MAKYIDRQEAIETVAFYLEDPDGVDHALKSIKDIPPADVQPVKHGRWVLDNSEQVLMHCSNCNWFNLSWKWKYCPYCGAKMDGA